MQTPQRYKPISGQLDLLQILIKYKVSFAQGNVIKYIARLGKKEGATVAEDLQKAIHYLSAMIDEAANVEQQDMAIMSQEKSLEVANSIVCSYPQLNKDTFLVNVLKGDLASLQTALSYLTKMQKLMTNEQQ